LNATSSVPSPSKCTKIVVPTSNGRSKGWEEKERGVRGEERRKEDEREREGFGSSQCWK